MLRSLSRPIANPNKFTSPMKNSARSRSRLARNRISKAMFETLEERRLMSLTIEVRNSDGSSTATTTTVGQVLNLDVLAVVTDSGNNPTADGVQDIAGSFVSSAVFGHAIAGNLAATNVTPFRASGANPGTQQDLNNDGNLDVGSNTNANLFFARSSPLQTGSSGTGTISGNSLIFKIASLTYTVTHLNNGGQTNINFSPFISTRPDAAAWIENGVQKDNLSGSFQAGTPYTVSNPTLLTAPVAVADTATVTRNTTGTINELANDDITVPLNPSSVVIVQAPTHGTTQLQTNGSIKYTPTAGYVGSDSFTYHVTDTDGRVSNTVPVNINVTLAPPPTAVDDSATTLRNTPVTVSVLANDTSVGTLTPSSVTIGTAAAHGTAVAQSDGTIIYTPINGYVGGDSFTYTVADSNSGISAPATVSITVNAPVPPTASDDSASTTAGAPVSIAVLANDTSPSSPLTATSVTLVTQPTHGTGAVQLDGTVLYTPTAGFTGSDSFTYTVADGVGDVSAAATVTLTVSNGVPPTATNVVAPVLADQSNIINVLSNVSSGAPVVPGSVAVVTQPVNGTATVNTSNGAISYVPVAGFIGTDTFTYTVGNANLDTTNTATVSVNVGTSISNAKGAPHSLVFTNAANGLETISLNKGAAQIFFTGTGSLTVAANGKATVTGTALNLGSITLTGTTKASVLSIKGSTKTAGTLGGITDAAPLGSIIAQSVNLTGVINLNSVSNVNVGSISNASISVGTTTAGKWSLTAGTVTESMINSAMPIASLKVASWVNTGAAFGGDFTVPVVVGVNPPVTITAPSVKTLTSAGAFAAQLRLSDNGVNGGLGSAKIGGALGTYPWTVGSIKTLSAGSVSGGFSASVVGALASLSVKSGGFAASIAAGSIGNVSIVGDLTSHSITAASVKNLKVTGAINGVTLTTTGNITGITAGSIANSNISAGVTAGLTVTTATAATLGGATIGTVKAGSFAASTILAGKVSAASLGTITTANGGTQFGIATKTINGFAGTFATGPLKLSHSALTSEELLQSYLNQNGVTFGDFTIAIDA